jgi:hypothetical protein
MIRSINQELMGEGCDLEILSTGLSPVAWNATATVTTITSVTKVEVKANDYSRTDTADINSFKVGDVIDYLPNGNHDAAITGLEIQAITGNIITFTTSHGITATGGTLEPTTYANASAGHQADAYLANASNLINSTVQAQEYS